MSELPTLLRQQPQFQVLHSRVVFSARSACPLSSHLQIATGSTPPGPSASRGENPLCSIGASAEKAESTRDCGSATKAMSAATRGVQGTL
jgi:hypothetical protein